MLLLISVGLRTIHLDADPAAWFIDEIGYQIDEGYKTLAPRNLSLYGTTQWNPHDEYTGWMTRSAMTQWAYYWGFKVFGTQLSSARVVSIIYAILLLGFTAVFLWRRYSPNTAVFGTLLLAADPGLFLFSRSALFETALAFFTYTALFIAVSIPVRKEPARPVLLAALSVPAFLFLKKSVLIYIGPAILALGLFAARQRVAMLLQRNRYLVVFAVLFLVAISGAAPFVYDYVGAVSPLHFGSVIHRPQKIFLNPVESLSPLALSLGYIALLDLLIRKPSAILNDGYRLALALIIMLAPIGLSFFIYNFPRYYIPVIPAALLMVVERLAIPASSFEDHRFRLGTLHGVFAAVVFLALAMTIWATLNRYVLTNLPIRLGEEPGLSVPALLLLYPLFLFLFACFSYVFVKFFRGWVNAYLIYLLVAVHLLVGLGVSTTAVTFPTYRTKAIQEAILMHVAPSRSLGGDWAPYFVVGTRLRVLYMRPDINGADHIRAIRPDYFLYSDTPYDRKNFKQITADEGIELKEPVLLGKYADRPISLYRIHYTGTNEQAGMLKTLYRHPK
ncbi:MAG: glycosyltransferase family 39 protein [Desulfobacteraceae bacterium]|nr:glycosyltransferase family 39 protein [Desulfobacteraceae bacterium]